MAKKQYLSSEYAYRKAKNQDIPNDTFIQEVFLRTCEEIMSESGLEEWSIDRMQGAFKMLEKFRQTRDE